MNLSAESLSLRSKPQRASFRLQARDGSASLRDVRECALFRGFDASPLMRPVRDRFRGTGASPRLDSTPEAQRAPAEPQQTPDAPRAYRTCLSESFALAVENDCD